MQHDLTKPCKECPFRKKSAAGWLGPWTAEELLQELRLGDLKFACHLTIKGEAASADDPGLQQCAGASQYGTNTCARSRDKDRLAHQQRLGKSKEVFDSPMAFIEHHTRLPSKKEKASR